jgi:DNA-binding CsgD family transcriptional regulator
MRLTTLLESAEDGASSLETGIVMLADDGSLVGSSGRGAQWLDELSDTASGHGPIPIEIQAVVARLRSMEGDAGPEPRIRVRTRAGRWIVIHATSVNGPGDAVVAVIIEAAAPTEVAPIIMRAYGLTSQERTITGLISRGLSTAEIADELQISSNTVQDHLKSIFGKTGTGSRAELVATLMRQQYLPRARAGARVGPTGFFA